MHPGTRRLAFSEFSADDGAPDPRLTAALESGDHGAVLVALSDARLLVPVVALLGETAYDRNGLKTDKSSDMAVVLVTGRDGRRALLAFSGTPSLRGWQPDARPMPAASRLAATAAVQEGAAAVVIDIAGPHSAVVDTDDLHHLAAGHRALRLEDGSYAWATQE